MVLEVGTHEATPERLRWMRTLACRAFWTASEGRPGPVHLNFPLREPLGLDGAAPPDDSGRAGDRPWVSRPPVHAAAEVPSSRPSAAAWWWRVAGSARTARRAAAAALAQAAGWPLLADPLSGARTGGAAIAHYDALLRDEAFADAHRPEIVLRVGAFRPPSRCARGWPRRPARSRSRWTPRARGRTPRA